MLRVSRPIEVVVLNCCVTATKVVRPVAVEQLNDLCEVRQRAGQAIDLVHNHRVDLMPGDVGKQPLQGRAFQRPAGEPAIVIGGLDQPPSLAPLAADESLASLALRVQRVEVLLQPFLGRFAGVDRAAPRRRRRRHGFTPKNRGPDQRAPVIRRATSDSERWCSPR